MNITTSETKECAPVWFFLWHNGSVEKYLAKGEGMAKKKDVRYSDREREQAYALWAVCGNVTEVSERLGIPRTTVSEWLKKAPSDDLSELRRRQKEIFIADAWRVIGDAQEVLRRRLERALSQEDAIDAIIDEVMDTPDTELSRDAKNSLIKKLTVLRCDDLSKIAVVLGTMYDKAALAAKDTAADGGDTGSLEDFDAGS